MIEEANKFKNILALALTADHKCLSELEPEVKHAVMFVCEMFPAKWEGKKIKFDINAPQADLAYSYKAMNKILKSLDPSAKGHRANYIHVIIDEPLPVYPETNVAFALRQYPNELYVPPKECKFDHLPPLKYMESVSFEDINKTIGAMIARIAVSHVRNIPLTDIEDNILYAIRDEEETFRRLANVLGLGSLAAAVLLYAPKTNKYPKGTLTYEESGSESTFLATYIYLASKGIYLKAKKNPKTLTKSS
ncbi:hypothetical protein NVX19_003621 [Salmonella enterica]|nr:hypothetical protein [Salmonella enterica]